jgi:DNA-binding PadR family transcriptional regulator
MQYDDTAQDGPTNWQAHKQAHKMSQKMTRRKAMRRGRGHAAAFEYGGRMRRGEIRTALLTELSEAPGHGYDLIQRLEEKSGGEWRPSPGSVYPTLQMLEDESLVRSTERDDKRVYEITDTGRAEAERRSKEAGGSPWEGNRSRSPRGQLKESAVQILLASRQLQHAGSDEQVGQALEIMRNARKQLYGLLAED